MIIDSFSGKYRFLSNFWPAKVMLDGEEYPTTEHAYQAAKFLDQDRRKAIQEASTPALAKKMGRGKDLRPDWEDVKLFVMEDLLRQKFQNKELKQLLYETGQVELVEYNYWHDNTWGSCTCKKCGDVGQNHLGKLLMKIRSELSS